MLITGRFKKSVVDSDQSKAGSRIAAYNGLATSSVFASVVESFPDAGVAAWVRTAVGRGHPRANCPRFLSRTSKIERLFADQGTDIGT
jgi:hypothetical protein